MGIFSKKTLSKMEQSELPKLLSDRTIIIKHVDNGGRSSSSLYSTL